VIPSSGTSAVRTVSAATTSLERGAGNGWLAVGDAALAHDPLAGRGSSSRFNRRRMRPARLNATSAATPMRCRDTRLPCARGPSHTFWIVAPCTRRSLDGTTRPFGCAGLTGCDRSRAARARRRGAHGRPGSLAGRGQLNDVQPSRTSSADHGRQGMGRHWRAAPRRTIARTTSGPHSEVAASHCCTRHLGSLLRRPNRSHCTPSRASEAPLRGLHLP
jgi:hypothetical protein